VELLRNAKSISSSTANVLPVDATVVCGAVGLHSGLPVLEIVTEAVMGYRR